MAILYKKFSENLKLFWEFRELLKNLVKREIAQRYKQSILGYAWIILNPLFQLVVMSFVFGVILKVSSLNVPFIIFLSVALLPWNFFATSLSTSSGVLVNSSSLITKIYFPREILVYANMFAKLIDFALSLLILIVFFLIFKIPFTIYFFWFIPILIVQIIFTTGLSLITSAFNLFYRDIQYLLNLILILWMYLTPVMYPVELIPNKYRFIFKFNPMAVIVNAYRQILLGKSEPNLGSLSIALFISIFIFIFGFFIFKKLEGKFADYV
ncbi:ABC transporter permease [Candidatus Beckwithbacteria bacterium]|nr:ABC transporter permease [Candidatus Beckwithbacteria bacterium]